jgi:Winged helix DNA-binding domain
VGTARKWIAALGDEVTPVEVEGVPAWMLAADARKLRDLEAPRSVRLLPAFDQYVVAASPHADYLLPGDWRRRVYRPQGWISPVLLVNGRMLGTWRHAIRGSRMEVDIQPFIKAPTWVRRSAAQEAERLAEFLGGTLRLEWKR